MGNARVFRSLGRGLLPVVLWTAVPPAPLPAQEPAGPQSGPRWFAHLSLERQFLDSDLPPWSDWTSVEVGLVREFNRGAVGVQAFRVERFGAMDGGAAVDLYRELWAGSYGNLRVRVAPGGGTLPEADVRGELFQALPGAWEVSGSWWRMSLPVHDVDVAGLGVARYVGDWYVREVTSLSFLAGESSLSASVSARRFLGSSREFLELGAGVGREAVVLGTGPAVDTRDTRFAQVRVSRFLGRRWGVTGTAGYHAFEGAPDRKLLAVGILARF